MQLEETMGRITWGILGAEDSHKGIELLRPSGLITLAGGVAGAEECLLRGGGGGPASPLRSSSFFL